MIDRGATVHRNRLDFATFLAPNAPVAVPGSAGRRDAPMTELEFQTKLAELDRLLNDPEVRMDPNRVWILLAEISAQELRQAGR